MPDWIDLSGQLVGELTVLRYSGARKWLCRCSCGREVEKFGASLRTRRTSVCSTAYHATGLHKRFRAEYNAWQWHKRKGMLLEWNESFARFLAGVGEKPTPKAVLIAPNKNAPMGPANFMWARSRGVPLPAVSADEG